MKATTVVVLLLLGIVLAEKTRWHELKDYSFEKYVKEYSKRYASTQEYSERKAIFEERLRKIMQHNNDPTKSWKEGVNHLSDRTPEEFEKLLGYKKGIAYSMKDQSNPHKQLFKSSGVSMDSLPKSVDWRDKGIITAVKDQGMCGSCWTFGTAETIESYWAMSSGDLMDLSEQQILDCTPNPNDCGGTGGCQGGTPELAYQQIINLGGLTTEWMYSYVSYFGQNFPKCLVNNTSPMATLKSYTVLPSNQHDPVMEALATVGPLAVNVDASAWSGYESGVFDGCNNTNPDIDHVVQLVGYGTDPSFGDYWLVRNSWNTGWGEKGYIRLRRTSTPRCGVDLQPQDGTGCNGGPSKVTVCGTCAILYDVSYPNV